MEQNAINKLFQFPLFPPLTYSETKEQRRVFAKYSFFIFRYHNDNNLRRVLHMSGGGDIIYLPLTVGLLYEYVIDKIQDKHKKEKLNQSIIDLLEAYNIIDCRSLLNSFKLPNEIIWKNRVG